MPVTSRPRWREPGHIRIGPSTLRVSEGGPEAWDFQGLSPTPCYAAAVRFRIAFKATRSFNCSEFAREKMLFISSGFGAY